jgi:hypothetical protein
MLLGMLYERRHTYEIKEYGGLATPMPVYSTIFLMITLSSVGLPLFNGFVGEFLVLSGAFSAKALYGILGTTGVIWSAGYLLWLYQRTFYGQITQPVNAKLHDADGRERISLIPLVAMALIMGVASPLWIRMIDPAVEHSLRPSNITSAQCEAPVGAPCFSRGELDFSPAEKRATQREALAAASHSSAKALPELNTFPGALKRSFPRINPPQQSNIGFVGDPGNPGAPTQREFPK